MLLDDLDARKLASGLGLEVMGFGDVIIREFNRFEKAGRYYVVKF